tara:strand:- start:3404 stop:4018 length:615 start_codon:yes stop_codon:yes gene_type:complete
MFVDLLCYIHGSGNCRLTATKDETKRLLNITESEQDDFEKVWEQFIECPEDHESITHLKMWDWFCSDREIHKVRQKAGRKGGKKNASKEEAKPKQSLSKAEAKGEQTLYVSPSLSPSPSLNKFIPPTIEDCIEYFTQNESSKIDAEGFFYFYESNGWKVGKNKMKQWKRAASGWITRNRRTEQKPNYQQTRDQKTREILKKAFE